MKKLVKNVLVMAMVSFVTGCASVSGVQNKLVNNTSNGVIYGTGATDHENKELSAKKFCEVIKNKDSRCANAENYVVVVISKFGFSDGVVGMNLLVEKSNKHIKTLDHKYSWEDKNIPFVKARVISGQYGELIDVVSTNGDGKCFWSGLPRAGGVVCPAYGYDYRKDFQGVVFR